MVTEAIDYLTTKSWEKVRNERAVEMDELRKELRAGIAKLRGEIAAVRAELDSARRG